MHAFFAFRRLLLLVLSIAVGIQLIVILYNHFSGYYTLDGFTHFMLRLLTGTFFSMLGGFAMAYPDLFLIRFLNRKIPWAESILKRVLLQFIFAALVAAVISTLVTLLVHTINTYEKEIRGVLISNAMIFAVVNILLMAVLEGWIAYLESRKARKEADLLQAELSQIRFEVMKSQINPHFMFNSLNVLSSLIDTEREKAQQFIDEFSSIYRYVLESIEEPLTTLSRELDFAKSYLFLQQIRYGSDLEYSLNINAGLLNLMLPPLSLQVILENSTKHNIVNREKPLRIQILNEGNILLVKNNLQPKISRVRSTGLGLKNLVRRYAMITDRAPQFEVIDGYYIARLPLLNSE